VASRSLHCRAKKAEKARKRESTRPIDLVSLTLSLYPSVRGRWSAFMYTVERWLLQNPAHPDHILTFQPVAPSDIVCWTSDFNTAVRWLRGGQVRKINGDLPMRRSARR
jgi:hypothetical protein